MGQLIGKKPIIGFKLEDTSGDEAWRYIPYSEFVSKYKSTKRFDILPEHIFIEGKRLAIWDRKLNSMIPSTITYVRSGVFFYKEDNSEQEKWAPIHSLLGCKAEEIL